MKHINIKVVNFFILLLTYGYLYNFINLNISKSFLKIYRGNTYNKLRKLKGYKELDHIQLEDGDSPQRFYNAITDEIKKNGLDKLVSGGYKVGKENSVGYGYVIYNYDINDLID